VLKKSLGQINSNASERRIIETPLVWGNKRVNSRNPIFGGLRHAGSVIGCSTCPNAAGHLLAGRLKNADGLFDPPGVGIAVLEASVMLKLSSRQYAGVVASLQSAAASAGSDKRQCTRMEIQAPVRVALMTDDKVTRCVIALIRDVSLSGVGLCQSPKLAPKEKFLISLPCAKQHIVVVCSATFCQPLADGIFWVGAQFESEADAAKTEEFRAFAAAAVKSAA
jgi:hypothetical protein